MEITNEIKLKVTAQYFGQNLIVCKPFQFWCDDNGDKKTPILKNGDIIKYPYPSNRMFYESDECLKLILKPLSAITDKDAITCLNILMGTASSQYKDWAKGMQEQWLKIIKVELVDGFGSVQMNIKPYFSSLYKVTQFLQSVGYDLPQYLLENQTLEQSGLATYETK